MTASMQPTMQPTVSSGPHPTAIGRRPRRTDSWRHNPRGTRQRSSDTVARTVGDRLRAARRRAGMTLADVAERSDGEFPASVVGAYERAERSISVWKLERLAAIYGAPAATLLTFARSEPLARPVLVVDIAALRSVGGAGLVVLERFVAGVRVARGLPPSTRSLALRESDWRAIAAMLDVEVGDLEARLRALRILRDR